MILKKNCQKCGLEFVKQPSHSMKYWNTKLFCGISCSKLGFKHSPESEAIRIESIKKAYSNPKLKNRFSEQYKKEYAEGKRSGSLGKHWNLSEETLKRQSLAQSGAKNPMWKDGISAINHGLLATDEWRKFRLTILKRDDMRCIDCGKQGGQDLEVDHIYPKALFPRLLLMPENCITRCRECHKNTPTYGGRVHQLTL